MAALERHSEKRLERLPADRRASFPTADGPDMNEVCRTHDLLLLVLDTLRFDVAVAEWQAGRIANLCRLLPGGWQERHSPGSFTYAAHQAFFAGFLPTPARVEPSHTRLFAARFAGSETVGPRTKVFDAPDWVTGLRAEGWRTVCVGGVGFFNRQTPLSRVLPALFEEAYWEPGFGVTEPESARRQFEFAAQRLADGDARQTLLFVNVSALHQPNHFYLDGLGQDSVASHAAALRYVDSQLPILLEALARRPRPTFCIVTSDHGTTYGENGWTGHRLAHPVVWTVPYGETVVPGGMA